MMTQSGSSTQKFRNKTLPGLTIVVLGLFLAVHWVDEPQPGKRTIRGATPPPAAEPPQSAAATLCCHSWPASSATGRGRYTLQITIGEPC